MNIQIRNEIGDPIEFKIDTNDCNNNQYLKIVPCVGNGFDGATYLVLRTEYKHSPLGEVSILLNGREVNELVKILQVFLREAIRVNGVGYVFDTSVLGQG